MAEEYIYAVARIKARETQLLTQQDIDRLMACKTPADCLRALGDQGLGHRQRQAGGGRARRRDGKGPGRSCAS